MPGNGLTIKVRGHSDADIRAVAAMHVAAIPTGFLSQCPRLLELLYKHMAADEFCFLVLGFRGGELAGFVSGTIDARKLFSNFKRVNFLPAFFAILPKLFSCATIKKSVETLLYPKIRPTDTSVKAELLSMAVKESFRGHGFAKALFGAFVEEQRKANVASFRIVAGGKLVGANKFYAKMGAKKIGEIAVHDGEVSQLYQFDVAGEIK